MVVHPPISSLFVVDEKGSSLEPFISYVESLPHVRVTVEPRLPQELHPYDVIVTANTTMLEDQTDGLAQFVRKGGGWLGLVDLSDKPLPQLFGAQPNPIGPSVRAPARPCWSPL
jgi:hypothetical protein